jgi:hypothetical protein
MGTVRQCVPVIVAMILKAKEQEKGGNTKVCERIGRAYIPNREEKKTRWQVEDFMVV